MKSISLMVVILLASLNCIVMAETYYVDGDNGNDDWNGLAETYQGGDAGPKQSIYAGVEVAYHDDTVIVSDGIYRYGGYILIEKRITLKSANGAENCKIVGGRVPGPALIIYSFADEGESKAVVDGFTIEWSSNKAVLIGHGSNAIVKNCVFSNCFVIFGVLTCSMESTPTIINCEFLNNSGLKSAAIVSEEGSHPVISGCKITASYGSHQLYDGAILCADSALSSVTIIDCEITGLDSPGVCLGENASATISNSVIEGSESGIICLFGDEDGKITVDNCLISNNSCYLDSSRYAYACAIDISGGKAEITNCDIAYNLMAFDSKPSNDVPVACVNFRNGAEGHLEGCDIYGNWIDDMGDAGGAVVQSEDTTIVTMKDCRIAENSAYTERFYGVYAGLGSAGLYMDGCEIISNINRQGNSTFRSLFLAGNEAEIYNCVFATGESAWYEAVINLNEETSTVDISNCTFFGSGIGVQAMFLAGGSGQVNVSNSIARGYQGLIRMFGNLDVTVNYSNVEGGWDGAGVGNIDVDPLFAEDGLDEFGEIIFGVEPDLHLMSMAGRYDAGSGMWVRDDVDSPCIDAGDPLAWIGDEPLGCGGRINMGAYGGTAEASLTDKCSEEIIGDVNRDCVVDIVDFAAMAQNWLVSTVEGN